MRCAAKDYVCVWKGIKIRLDLIYSILRWIFVDRGRGHGRSRAERLRFLQSAPNSEAPGRRREENSIPNVIEAEGFFPEGGGLDGSPRPRRPCPLSHRLIEHLMSLPVSKQFRSPRLFEMARNEQWLQVAKEAVCFKLNCVGYC
ncbi:uncharacterized protein LOC113462426 isoform X2 [Phoenix dactylifera]|uniref:Uncharacterized protein LOC113462426 isoform X2 n=1 Tax=Phoenix dactylifera TaxID=42345 RepID=A0A8B9ADS9_PHODC|nr:uncharacterized protein LOC113462426 isoform X2 [Phoenix dactylifera]